MIGRTFTGVTHTGRIISLAKVMCRNHADSPYQYKCQWFDENGKHYEWFNLDDTEQEFREISFIS